MLLSAHPAVSAPAAVPVLRRVTGLALATALVATLAGCGGMPTNRQLESVHQPVVERSHYSFDLTSGPGGLPASEQSRLEGWFDAMNLRYGDRVAIDDPLASAQTRAGVEAVAGKFGILLSAEVPVTAGYVNPGLVRIILTRTAASVPHCPDWSANSESNLNNATGSNYGCSVNSNLAAMVANPEDLLHGARGPESTLAMSSDKAIAAYRKKAPTGEGALKSTSSTSGAN